MKIIEDAKVEHKRKRYNKNKKKAWRKKIDITDVEEGLEDKCREERYGGLLKERESSDILFLDTGENDKKDGAKGTLEYAVATYETSGTKSHVGVTPRVKNKQVKRLKCHSLLNGLPGAKPPKKMRKKTNVEEVKVNPITKKFVILEAGDHKKILKKQNFEKQMQILKNGKDKKPRSRQQKKFTEDLWEDPSEEVTSREIIYNSYTKDLIGYYKDQTKTQAYKVPGCRFQKTSSFPAVHLPSAGTSYNPSYVHHQALLKKAIKREEKRLSVIAQVERKTTLMFPTADKAPTTETYMMEMAEGLPVEGDTEEKNAPDDEAIDESGTNIKKVNSKKKLKKKRVLEKKAKVAKDIKKKRKLLRINENEVFKIKTFKKELDLQNALTEEKKATRKRKIIMKKNQASRLSKLKFDIGDVEIALGDEMVGKVRLVKPVVNSLAERFKSLQRRNLVETRQPFRMKRKYKLKKIFKKGFKLDFDNLPTYDSD